MQCRPLRRSCAKHLRVARLDDDIERSDGRRGGMLRAPNHGVIHRLSLVAVIVCALARPSIAGAAEPVDLDARLAFLEAHIDAQRTHAEVWWGG